LHVGPKRGLGKRPVSCLLWDGISSLLLEMVDATTVKQSDQKPQWISEVMNWESGEDLKADTLPDRRAPVAPSIP